MTAGHRREEQIAVSDSASDNDSVGARTSADSGGLLTMVDTLATEVAAVSQVPGGQGVSVSSCGLPPCTPKTCRSPSGFCRPVSSRHVSMSAWFRAADGPGAESVEDHPNLRGELVGDGVLNRFVRECAENDADVARVDVELLGQLVHSDRHGHR